MIIFKDFCGFSKKYSIQSTKVQEKGAKDAKNVELWGNKMQSAKLAEIARSSVDARKEIA